MARQVGTYKTRNGKGEYTFGFRNEGGRIEVDIEATPSFNGRPTDGHSTHRLPSSQAATGTKICFAQPETVRTMEQAKRFAQGWAESTQDYIEKGKRF
jgi:hypothetical protein